MTNHKEKLFALFFAMILVISIIIGLIFVLQHIELNQRQVTIFDTITLLNNTQTQVLENQRILLNLNINQTEDINIAKETQDQLLEASNNLIKDINISMTNEERLIRLLDQNTNLTNDIKVTQDIIKTVLNKTRDDNLVFFKILGMDPSSIPIPNNQTQQNFKEYIEQIIVQQEEDSKKLDKLLKQFPWTDLNK